ATKAFTYVDDQTSSTTQQTPGTPGRRWDNLGNTQDGDVDGTTVNDGGCPSGVDPEDPSYNFARVDAIMTATKGPVNDPTDFHIVVGPDLKANVDMPVTAAAYSQLKTYPISPPPGPCQPSVAGSN